jgi:hypothetical protein
VVVLHVKVDLWYKVLGLAQVVVKRLRNYHSSQKETVQSNAMIVSELLDLHERSVVGK